MLVYNYIISISKEMPGKGNLRWEVEGQYVCKNSLIFLLLYDFFLYSNFAYLTL